MPRGTALYALSLFFGACPLPGQVGDGDTADEALGPPGLRLLHALSVRCSF